MPRVIALTGATGFIGSAVLNRLRSAGFQVRALYREASAAKRIQDPNVRWVPGRLDDADSLRQLLSGADTVIHLAGVVRGAEWQHFKKVNTDGVARMVQAAKRMHPSPRFLLLSSLAAREPHLSHYAASKRRGEGCLASEGHDLDWVILRPPAVYGPGDREIAPLFQLMAKGLAPQATPRSSRFGMIYIDDLVEAIVALMGRKGWPQTVLEVHDGRSGGYDWSEIVQMVSRVVGRAVFGFKVPRLLIRSAALVNVGAAWIFGYAPMLSPGKVRELEHGDWTCDNAAITALSGWRPSTSLEDGIKKTLVYLGVIADKSKSKTRGARHADV